MANFEFAVNKILEKEGGYVNDPHDRGGATRYGITERVARQHGYEGDMRNFPISLAKEIYKKDYWDAIRLDEVNDDCAAYEIFEFGVNSGTKLVTKKVQYILNIQRHCENGWDELTEDGIVGKKTIDAINKALIERNGRVLFVTALNCLQGHHLLVAAERNPNNAKFLKGWFKHRVNFILF